MSYISKSYKKIIIKYFNDYVKYTAEFYQTYCDKNCSNLDFICKQKRQFFQEQLIRSILENL